MTVALAAVLGPTGCAPHGSGDPPGNGGPSGTGDANGTANGTDDANGPATSVTAFFKDDFESGVAGNQPAGWDNFLAWMDDIALATDRIGCN